MSGLARREQDRAGERGELLSRSPLMSHSGMDVGGFGTKPRLEPAPGKGRESKE